MLGIWHQSKWTRRMLAVSVGVVAFAAQPYRPVVFMGTSMEPTYDDHSFAIGIRPNRPLTHGDVVVIDTPKGRIVKRVAFVGGDPIQQVKSGSTWMENLTARWIPASFKRLTTRTISVPKGFIYVLGDNVTNSMDSRELGFLPVSEVSAILLNPRPKRDWSGDNRVCATAAANPSSGVPSKLSGKNVRLAEL